MVKPPSLEAGGFQYVVQRSFSYFRLGVGNRHPAFFGWVFELVVTSLYRHFKPPIRFYQLNYISTSHQSPPYALMLCMVHTICMVIKAEYTPYTRKPFARRKSLLPKKKRDEKALIPLPPTGFALVFCANHQGGAIKAPGQAGRGASWGNGNCTV